MMKKYFIIYLISIFAGSLAFAQRPERESSKDTTKHEVKNQKATLDKEFDGGSTDKEIPEGFKTFKATLDKEFDGGSKIEKFELTDSKTQDLALLCKVWGFLKYHHPAIGRGDYNWDYELFRILPKIIEAKSQQDINTVLSRWIQSLGKVKKRNYESYPNSLVKLQPDFSWLQFSALHENLIKTILKIKSADRPQDQYYIGLYRYGNAEFKNELSYDTIKFPDSGFRLLTLYRFWNIIQYFFPYKYLTDKDWNEVLLEFIPKVLNAKNEVEYKLSICELIASISDTHANSSLYARLTKGQFIAPYKIGFIENKIVIINYLNFADSDSKKTGIGSRINKKVLQKDSIIVTDQKTNKPIISLEIGDIIEKIDEISIEDLIEKESKYVVASNKSSLVRDIIPYLFLSKDTILDVQVRRKDSIFVSTLACYPLRKIDLGLKNQKDTCFKMIGQSISYINPETLENKVIDEIVPQILQSKGLIVDFRCYPKDDFIYVLCNYLLPDVTNFAKFSKVDIHQPGLFILKDSEDKIGKVNPDYYKGKVVIIVNESTQSAAEFQTMALRMSPKALVIGSQTAGADGDVSDFVLPGGIEVGISALGVYYPDGRETQRVGINIDIEVKPTIKGIREGRDELLEKAIELINEE